jgi:uncharacterized RDD family membrane protein YckC
MNDREDALRSPAADDPRKYRTFWPRLGAMFLDGGVLAPFAWLDQLIWNHTAQSIVLLSWAVFYSFVSVVYEVLFVALYGQTLGKMACGVRVYDLSGQPVSPMQAMLRHIVPILFLPYFAFIQVQNILAGHLGNRAMGDDLWGFGTFFLLMFGWLALEVVTMLTNRKRRAVHDFIAGTVVVRESPRTPLRWWLAGLLVLSFVVPHFIEERNIARAPQVQPAP